MKKKLILILILACLLFLPSCAYSETELKNRLIIEGIGIDFDEKNGEYILTAEALSVSPAAGKDSGNKNQSATYTVKGKSIAKALGSLGETAGKNPMYSQNRIIIIGESLHGKRISAALDFFVREYTSRADVLVAAAAGSAADILKTPADGKVVSEIIEKSIEERALNSAAVKTALYNVVNLSLEKTTAFALPLLEVTKDSLSGKNAVKVTGTYIYTEDGNIDRLSDGETVFLQMITGNAKKGTIRIKVGDASAGLDIVKCKTKINTEIRNGKPFFDIKVKCSVDMVEYASGVFGDFGSGDIEKIARAAEKYITSGITSLLQRQLKQEKRDVFRFGRYIMREDYDLYKKTEDNWEESMSETEYNVSTKVNVRRIGQETMKIK